MYIQLLRPDIKRRRAVVSGACFGLACGLATGKASGQYLTEIGVTQLRALDPTLTGSGVYVGQPEGQETNNEDFEVNPSDPAITQSASIFTYASTNGGSVVTVTGVGPPNAAGIKSDHAINVGAAFYGHSFGVAPGVSHVDNFEADYFYNDLIHNQTAINPKVVNQSFSFGSQYASVDMDYDNYVNTYNTIFVSAMGGIGLNGNEPTSPGTMYNGISVNVYLGTGTNQAGAPHGPSADGRSVPDISAPPEASYLEDTSYVTPAVAGAAAILVQAGARGDGGAGTLTNSQDPRTIKALLLNGAVKPSDWHHTTTAPLDPSYGAGVLNIYNSYLQLQAGQHSYTTNTATSSLGAAHLPLAGVTGNVPTLSGWDYNTITSTATTDSVNHYFFNLTSSVAYNLSATLDWNRQYNQNSINKLDLYLYNANTNALMDESISTVDNVQELYDLNLPAGRYDLEVLKNGGVPGITDVSNAETYAMAFDFTPVPEPSSALLVCGASLMLLKRRRTRRPH